LVLVQLGAWSLAAVPLSAQRAGDTRQHDEESSVIQIQASIKREPRNSALYIKLGQACWKNGDYQQAFDAFKQAVKLAPTSAETHNWMGAFLMGRRVDRVADPIRSLLS